MQHPPTNRNIMATMTLKERIESRVEFRKIRLGRKTAFTASAFIDDVLYETTKATKELCVADLVRKAERKDGIHADSIKGSSRPNYGKCGSMKRNPGHAFIEPFAPCTKGHERHIPHNQDN